MFKSSFTGIGRYTFELVKNLQILSAQPQPQPQPQLPHEFVLFFNEPEFTTFTVAAPNFKKVLAATPHYSIKEQTKFLKILNREKLDLMHFTHFNAPIKYKKPFIVTIHDLTHTLFPGRKMQGLVYRLAYKAVVKSAVKKAKRIIAVSQNTKEDLQRILNVSTHRIDVVYEGVNEEYGQFSDAKKEEAKNYLKQRYKIKPPFLLYTGVHRYHKNLPRLIKAFKLLALEYPKLQLVITGKEDPIYPEVENEAKTHNLEKKIIFPGLVPEEDLIALYNLAEVYVFPSLYEGFGLPILEAMQCGTPVCASNSSSLPEVAGEGNALFFDPNEETDIAAKIAKLLEDESLRKDLIERGLQRVKDFSWKKMAQEILKIYETAI